MNSVLNDVFNCGTSDSDECNKETNEESNYTDVEIVGCPQS